MVQSGAVHAELIKLKPIRHSRKVKEDRCLFILLSCSWEKGGDKKGVRCCNSGQSSPGGSSLEVLENMGETAL